MNPEPQTQCGQTKLSQALSKAEQEQLKRLLSGKTHEAEALPASRRAVSRGIWSYKPCVGVLGSSPLVLACASLGNTQVETLSEKRSCEPRVQHAHLSPEPEPAVSLP